MAYRSKFKGKEIDDRLDLVEELSEEIKDKQDNIEDLDDIRDGANKGATALQSIPEEYITETELEGKGYATVFQVNKKQDVISDLDTIRTNSEKGATALQEIPSEYITESELNNKGFLTQHQDISHLATKSEVTLKLNNKVDKVNGKQLSTEDFTTALKNKLSSLSNYDDSTIKNSLNSLQSQINTLINGDVSTAIETFNEIIAFLSGIKDTESLSGIIASIEMQISNAINTASTKQDTLISGRNIKTINGESILGEGNINIEGGSAIPDLEGYATEEYVNNAVEEVNVKGEDGYVYSNGEKVDMRFTRSLIPVGTSIPAKANLNTVEYLRVGKYYCSLNVDAKTITNCPTANAFMMEVFNPLSTVVDNEIDSTHVYRIRILTEYSTGIQYVQYCTVGSTVNKWTYDSWYVCPRTKFTLNSSKNDGSAALGSATQGVYINAEGTFVKMSYTLGKSVPSSAVFTDTKVTAVGNHYVPVEDASVVIEAPDGEVVIGLKRDAAGHVVGVTSTPMGGGGITVETDPVFLASPAATITNEKIAVWDDKQGAIADLATIRDGASKGATAVQTYIVSFDICGLLNGETISEVHTDELRIAINAHKLILIPIDVSSPMFGYVPMSAWVEDLIYFSVLFNGTIIYGEISFNSEEIYANDIKIIKPELKQDALVSGENIKTINGESILGNGNIEISSGITSEVYITDFTMKQLRQGMYNGTQVDCLMQHLVTAMNANKIILVREGEDLGYKGVYVLNGFAEDLLYFSIVDTDGSVLWCEGTNLGDEYIDGRSLHVREWDDKQDTLVSGETIKTINGESILGSGNITISGGGGASGSAQLPANYISSNVAQGCIIPSGKVTIFSIPQTEGVTMRLSTVDMESGKDSAWVIRFSIGADNTGVYVVESEDNFSLKWANGIAPTFENGKYYEMSFRLIGTMFLGVWASFE